MVHYSHGKTFVSDATPRQHQTDNDKCTPTKTTKINKRGSSCASKDAWLWKHVLRTTTVDRINYNDTEPSSTPVSSISGYQLVCSYNWRTGKDMRLLHIPGHAAVWQGITLPATLPKDQGVYFVDQNAALAPKFPFEPMFRATTTNNPEFRFDDVDILANRNSLRKLLDFSGGRRQDSFRLNLHLIHRTLVIERCERNVRQLISGSQNPGWGKSFEQRCTEYPSCIEDSASHHRSLRYRLGDLNCVVQFEVDACYDKGNEQGDGAEALSLSMDRLSINNSTRDNTAIVAPPDLKAPMAQDMAAEIKTESKQKSLGQHLPQLWFGRTPWLIVGRHTQGTFTECHTTKALEHFNDWEDRNQSKLRMLVTVLGQLREAVERNKGHHCIAICQKTASLPVIEVFPSTVAKMAAPDELKKKLWNAEAGGSSTDARP